jgi:hypothetical protein
MPLIQSSAAFAQVTSHLVEVGGADHGDQELSSVFVLLKTISSARMNYC